LLRPLHISCRTAETHELAKRKAGEMDKIRNAFGLEEGVKEGQAFDRDLQVNLGLSIFMLDLTVAKVKGKGEGHTNVHLAVSIAFS